MTSQGHSQERRKDPRVRNNVPVKITNLDGDQVTETANISRSGAYCRVEKYIEPMTKLNINLLVPFRKNKKVSSKKVNCGGVVIRTEPVPGQEAFNIAIFFNDITKKDADCISDYVSFYLEKDNS
ncbi:MAG: PilZ domain-containing protein [Candidatus Omnitrophica bacterium]|nr:PilZ domain-containing protein [Candidatus Omnitrophota bacterium]